MRYNDEKTRLPGCTEPSMCLGMAKEETHLAKDASMTFCGQLIRDPAKRNVDPALNTCSKCAIERHKWFNPCPSHNPV